jgi:hypothetical protein
MAERSHELNGLQNGVIGSLAGMIEVILQQPTISIKNATQVSLSLLFSIKGSRLMACLFVYVFLLFLIAKSPNLMVSICFVSWCWYFSWINSSYFSCTICNQWYGLDPIEQEK